MLIRRRDILLYRRTEKPRIDIDDPEFGAKKKQYDLVNAFLARLRNPDGSFADSVTDYAAPDALAQRLVSVGRNVPVHAEDVKELCFPDLPPYHRRAPSLTGITTEHSSQQRVFFERL
jgi:hypothetical protein